MADEEEEVVEDEEDPDESEVGEGDVRKAEVGLEVKVAEIDVASSSSDASDTVAVKAGGVTLATETAAGGVHIPLLNVVAATAGSPPPSSAPASSAATSSSSSCLLVRKIGSAISKIEPVEDGEELVEEEEGLGFGGLTLMPRRGLVAGWRLRHAEDAPGHMMAVRC